MSDTYTVQRSATVMAPAADVYAQIIDFHKWEDWSPWDDMDPEMDKRFVGPDSGVGSGYAWLGNRKVGKGKMKITAATEPSNVQIDLEFLKPFKASNKTEFTLSPSGEGTEVNWAMTGKKTFMTKVMGIFKSMDSMVGPDFERGLANLKKLVESS